MPSSSRNSSPARTRKPAASSNSSTGAKISIGLVKEAVNVAKEAGHPAKEQKGRKPTIEDQSRTNTPDALSSEETPKDLADIAKTVDFGKYLEKLDSSLAILYAIQATLLTKKAPALRGPFFDGPPSTEDSQEAVLMKLRSELSLANGQYEGLTESQDRDRSLGERLHEALGKNSSMHPGSNKGPQARRQDRIDQAEAMTRCIEIFWKRLVKTEVRFQRFQMKK